MIRKVRSVLVAACWIACCCALRAGPVRTETAPGPPTAEELAAGKALAEHLCSLMPEEDSTVTGKLIIKSGESTKEVPISCKVSVHATNWETDYETSATAQTGPERLVVIHDTNGPNQYLYARADSPSAPLPAPAPITVSDAPIPLAGSDFSLGDLGLEFLHWPVQRQLKGEMRLGQPCYVLESSMPNGGGIVRVRSDIDKETGGLLIAEAFDANSNMIKEFSLHASSFKKVNGRWQVEKMDISNKKNGSRTELKFDLNK